MSKQPHPHAAVIHAYADGAEIEYLSESGAWHTAHSPHFVAHMQYRVKPEPVRVYPETKMELCDLLHHHGRGAIALANAALRHAIDNFQVVPTETVEKLSRRLAKAEAELVRALDPKLRLVQIAIDKDAETIFKNALAGEV